MADTRHSAALHQPTDPLSLALASVVTDVVRAEIGPAVEAAIARAIPDVVRRAALPAYLSTAELAELTGWSVRKIAYLRERRRLPYHKVGRSVRFRTADVEELLDEGRVEARIRMAASRRES